MSLSLELINIIKDKIRKGEINEGVFPHRPLKKKVEEEQINLATKEFIQDENKEYLFLYADGWLYKIYLLKYNDKIYRICINIDLKENNEYISYIYCLNGNKNVPISPKESNEELENKINSKRRKIINTYE